MVLCGSCQWTCKVPFLEPSLPFAEPHWALVLCWLPLSRCLGLGKPWSAKSSGWGSLASTTGLSGWSLGWGLGWHFLAQALVSPGWGPGWHFLAQALVSPGSLGVDAAWAGVQRTSSPPVREGTPESLRDAAAGRGVGKAEGGGFA
eukprot:1158594-Pelagomonas_calceolata.AAC.4